MNITQAIKEAKTEQEKFDLLKNNLGAPIDYPSLSYEELLIAVKAGHLLRWFSKRVQTPEMCKIAVDIDGVNIRDVSKRLITKELCYRAVQTSAQAVAYIPDQYRDYELLEFAVRCHAKALFWIRREKERTLELCYIAVAGDGCVLSSVPAKYKKLRDIQMIAIRSNGLALGSVPKSRRTKAMCYEAVEQNPFALQFVPEEWKDESLCMSAISRNGAALAYATAEFYTKENILKAYTRILEDKAVEEKTWNEKEAAEKRLNIIFENVPKPLQVDYDIILMERKLGLREVTRKYYSAADHLFHVVEGKRRQTFSTFDSFYSYLSGDMRGADLRKFSFAEIEPGDYSFDGALLRASDDMRLIVPDYQLYTRVKDHINGASFPQTKAKEIIKAESVLHELSVRENDIKNRRIFYISDIHITHKIAKRGAKNTSYPKLKKYIDSKVAQMVESAAGHSFEDLLLIAGDVSYDFQVSELFYRSLAEKWRPERIVVVLGNHELWDSPKEATTNDKLNHLISQYRSLFKELRINFLYNELYVESTIGFRNWSLPGNRAIFSYDELVDARPVDIEDYCEQSSIIILGGVGFSGYNKEFNASHGVYKQTICSHEDDLCQTQLFEKIYERIYAGLWNRTVIVLTHMPFSDWSEGKRNPNWIYVNGHTHYNDYCCDQEKTYYADNQIGYSNTTICLKWFYTKRVYGAFDYYPNGVFPVDRKKYMDYMRAIGIGIQFSRTDGQVLMLKSEGFFCFLFKSTSGELYILDGGVTRTLERDDVSYYFDEMALYGAFVKKVLSGYTSALQKISAVIKKLGGSGTIHGAIVDIDFFNHVYLNPADGTLTFYYANSMTDKYVFSSFQSLLESQRPDMYEKYQMLIGGSEGEAETLQIVNIDAREIPDYILHVTDTSIYSASRRLKAFQYLTEHNIIRVWDKDLIALMREELDHQEDYLLSGNSVELTE